MNELSGLFIIEISFGHEAQNTATEFGVVEIGFLKWPDPPQQQSDERAAKCLRLQRDNLRQSLQ